MSYIPYKSVMNTDLTYKNLGGLGGNDYSKLMKNYKGGSPSSSSSSKQSGWTPNLWSILSGTLGQLGGMVTDNIYHDIRGGKDLLGDRKNVLRDLTDILGGVTGVGGVVHGITNGAEGQWKAWKNGFNGWEDIPGIGFLHGMDEGWKRGSDIMDVSGASKHMNDKWIAETGKFLNQFTDNGVMNNTPVLNYLPRFTNFLSHVDPKGNMLSKNLAGMGVDILADPLTYLDGVGLVSKGGKLAEMGEIANQASKLGIDAKQIKNAEHFNDVAKGVLKNKYTAEYAQKLPNIAQKSPNIIENIAEKQASKEVGGMMDSIKAARETAEKANMNKWGASIPFTNKHIVLGNTPETLGKIGKWNIKNPVFQTEAKMVNDAHTVENLIHKASMRDENLADLTKQMVLKHYGVNDLSELTKSQFDDLHSHLSPLVSELEKEHELPKSIKGNFEDAENALKPRRGRPPKDPLKNMKIPEAHDPFETHIDPHNAKLAEGDTRKYNNTIDKMLNSKYKGGVEAKTEFEHFLDRKNPFNARTLRTGDKLLDSMGDHIQDAHSQMVGEKGKYTTMMNKVTKFMKKNGMKEDTSDMMDAIYHLEGKAPKSYGANWTASEKAQKLAEKIKPILNQLKEDDIEGGTLSPDKVRDNYFPHVVNGSRKDVREMDDFIKRNPSNITGMSQQNVFGKSRNGFQTMADHQDYIEEMEQKLLHEKDPVLKEEMEQKLDKVRDMYNTNITEVLQKRIRESIRANAMKAMQKELTKYGKLAQESKYIEDVKGLQKLSKSDAEKLGLPTKDAKGEDIRHYIHKDVLANIKKVDNIFTTEGMNKFVRHMTAVADAWRPLVTVYKISHYTNNIIGNTIMNIVAGVKPNEVIQAGKLLTRYHLGQATEADMKILKMAFKKNIISGGFLHDSDATYKFADPTKMEKIAHAIGHNKVIHKVRGGMEHFDDVSRLSNFMNGLDKFGGDAVRAARQTREFLFNYNELTHADKIMRAMVLPFWNWTKRNLPLQMKLLMTQPKYAMNSKRFLDLFNNGQPGADWQKEGGIHINKDEYTTIPNPIMDLDQLINPAQVMSGGHPIPRMLTELAMNKKFYTGNPISYGSKSVNAQDVPGYLASNFGITGNVYDYLADLANKKNKENFGQKTRDAINNMIKPTSKINHKRDGG